jgi:hypothetical protein
MDRPTTNKEKYRFENRSVYEIEIRFFRLQYDRFPIIFREEAAWQDMSAQKICKRLEGAE